MNEFLKKWHVKNLGLYLIIAINLALTAEFLYDHTSARYILGFFWAQSILLGLENVLKIIFAKTGEIINMNNKPTPTTISSNIFTALFFCFHFGVFIIVIGLIAVLSKNIPDGNMSRASYIMPTLLLMVVGVLIEIPGKIISVRKESPGFARLMFTPYLRLLPFGVIILGNNMDKTIVFILFLVAKMIVDIAYYYISDKPANRHLIDAI